MSKIFIIGRRRTGRQTIIKALTILGFQKKSILTANIDEDIEGILFKAKKYDVVAIPRDYTTNEIRAIELEYPDSRFILTKRDSDIWYSSFVRYYNGQEGEHPQTVHTNKGHYVSKFYEEYNEQIKTHFFGRDWKLLTITLDGSHTWQSICSYLKKPIPSEKFPHENRS